MKMKDYFMVDGEKLKEKNPKWLQDDYVKFIRFAQDKMDRCERGIVAIITNHSFLDNPTFRGMRQSLMNSFHQLYFLDLHGNSKKKEKSPDGSTDENVFDIEQGVAISILVKNPDPDGSGQALPRRIAHAELWGSRTSKYHRLAEDSLDSVTWQELKPNSPFYFFVPVNELVREEYEQGQKLTDIFSLNTVGIVTAKDKLTIHFTEKELWETVTRFSKMHAEEARRHFDLGDDSRDWTVKSALEDVQKNLQLEKVKPIHYRPFDTRFTLYTGNSRGFYSSPQRNVMQHLLPGTNVALITAKSNKSPNMNHFFVSKYMTETKCGESTTQSYTFPLYRYTSPGVREENLSPAFRARLDSRYGKTYPPETVLGYCYAVLYSPAYRRKYAEFLKSDFPRIPFPAEAAEFEKLAALGWELARVHLQEKGAEPPLLRSPGNRQLGDFIGEGEDTVEYVRFDPYPHDRTNPFPEHFTMEELGIVRINKDKFFDLVPKAAWEFQIGGYQVLQKFLKDRKGRRLIELDEIEQYEQIVRIIHFSLQRMGELNRLTEAWI